MSDVISITKDLIRCASVTPRDEGALAVLENLLRAAGFECHRLPFGEGAQRIENLFARIGKTAPHICYAGHTDVVPPGAEDKWTYPPFEPTIKDGVLYGRGASDMKGSVAAFTAAAISYVKKNGAPKKGSISLLITGDEEADAINGTVKVLEWMDKNGHTPDICLVGEPTNPSTLGEEIKIGRRGSFSGTITVQGKQGHVAYPDRAKNPLPVLVALVDALAKYKFDEGSEHFPPTNLEITTIDVGNKAGNVIPASGTAKFNVRFNDRWTPESLEKKIRATLDAVSRNYTLETFCGAENFITKPGAWSQSVAQAVQEFTGKMPKLSTSGGTSDARFVAKYCPVVEFGPINATIHQVDENARVSDLETLVKIYERIIELQLS